MFYNHYFQVTVLNDDGLETWQEGYASDFGVQPKDNRSWSDLINEVQTNAMDEAKVYGYKPVSAKISWREFGAACSQDLECAHKTISQLLELIRDEAPGYVSADAEKIAREFGFKQDRIDS
jgi:hypothetical protein